MRRLVIALALLAAGLAIADHQVWRRSQLRLLALAEDSGLSRWRPDVGRDLGRRTSPMRAATLLAWSLIELETDRARLADLPAAERPAESRRGIERLRLAERLAGEILPRSPASWQAHAALGAGRFLAAGREGRRTAPAASWRGPLLAAMRLAPGYGEPAILLASAELSRWSGLSPGERDRVVPVLARAFEESRGLDLLLPAWIRLAPGLDRLLEPIPDQAAAWLRLAAEFRRAGDLERFAVAHLAWRRSLPALFAERLEDARARLRAGDRRAAEALARSVLSAPHASELTGSFAAALAMLPDEAAGGASGGPLRRWLRWALDLCVLGRCPLDGDTLSALGRRAPGLEPVERALAALAGGRPEAARRLQPAAGEDGEGAWRRYWLYRALQLASSDPGEARRALAHAAGDDRDELQRRLATLRLAAAHGDAAARAAAGRRLAELERRFWPAESWLRRGAAYRLELVAAAPRDGVRLELGPAAPTGAVVELVWDGALIGAAALAPGEARYWRFLVSPGVHLAELTNLTGQPLRPASLRLGPPATPG